MGRDRDKVWKAAQLPGWLDPPPQDPVCLHCGYDLAGFAVGQVCPECGVEIVRLFEPVNIPRSAVIGVACGIASLGSFAGGLCIWPLAVLWPVLAAVGLPFAAYAWHTVRRDPSLYMRKSGRVARTGLWLCAPGVVVLVLLLGLVVWALLSP